MHDAVDLVGCHSRADDAVRRLVRVEVRVGAGVGLRVGVGLGVRARG